MADIKRINYGQTQLQNFNYGNSDVRLIKCPTDCVWQDMSRKSIQIYCERPDNERYIDRYELSTVEQPCPNGCGSLSHIETNPTYTGHLDYNDYWLNTTRLRVIAYDAQITPEEYWDWTYVIPPSATDIQNTSVTLSNLNPFAVTCYYGTSSGATTYSRTIGVHSTTVITGLTKGTTYYFFYRVDRTQYRKTTKRMNMIINTTTGQRTAIDVDVYIDIPNTDDVNIALTIYGTENYFTEQIGTGTLDSSIIPIVPQVAEWHVMWTGKDYKTPTKTQTTYNLNYFSGLQVGNNNLRVTGYYRNTPAGNYTITQADLPFSITNGSYTATLYSMECTASDTLRVSIKASAALTNFYFTKIEQYY